MLASSACPSPETYAKPSDSSGYVHVCKCQGTCIAHVGSTEPAKRSRYAPCSMRSHSLTYNQHVLHPRRQSKTWNTHPQQITQHCCSFYRPRKHESLCQAICQRDMREWICTWVGALPNSAGLPCLQHEVWLYFRFGGRHLEFDFFWPGIRSIY